MRALACLLAGLVTSAAWADRGAIRRPLEQDSEQWHYAAPFWLRLGVRTDLYLASLGDGSAPEVDLTGRRGRMVYDFAPVGVLSGTADFAWRGDATDEPVRVHLGLGVGLGLGAGYADEGAAGPLQALGAPKNALTLLTEAMLSYAGVVGFVAYSRFEDGQITYLESGSESTRPFTLERLVGRAGYEVAPFEQFVEIDGRWRTVRPFGFTAYLQAQRYAAPRVVYRVTEAGDDAEADYRYVGELPPQEVALNSVGVGGSAILMVGRSDDLRSTAHLELGGALGPGWTTLDLGEGEEAVDLWAGTGSVNLLLTHRVPIEGTGLFELSVQYNVELVNHWLRGAGADTWVVSGLDLFHGPRLELVLRM